MIKYILKNPFESIKTAIKIIKKIDNWHDYFLDLIQIKKEEYILKSGDLAAKVRPQTSDRGIVNEIWANKIYTPKSFDIKQSDIIVDIGANIGIFSILAAKKAKNGKVFAFEPINKNFKRLNENIKLNNLKNIISFKKAVSNKNKKIELFISNDNEGGHSIYANLTKSKNKQIVNALSLKNIFKENNLKNIDFLKIDCEGGEYDILLNSKKELKKINKISMEVHNLNKEKNIKTLKKFLEENKFKIKTKKNMLYAIK